MAWNAYADPAYPTARTRPKARPYLRAVNLVVINKQGYPPGLKPKL